MLNLDKLNKLSTLDTTWREDAIYRQENSDWLFKSAKIALVVLRALKDKSMSQKDLAAYMNVKPQQVNKIVKGRENLTLETICKLEKALNLKIVDISIPYTAQFVIENIHINKRTKHASNIIPFKFDTYDFGLDDCVYDYKNAI